jgi:ADP-ribosylglycohydrolase
VARLKAAKAFPHDRALIMDTLFNLWGTGLPSCDVCGAVFAIFAYAKDDVWEAIKMAAELGGDTDTIGALVAALCAAYAKGHNIPADVVAAIREQNAALFASKLGEDF